MTHRLLTALVACMVTAVASFASAACYKAPRLSESDTYWNGSDGSGQFMSGNTVFSNHYSDADGSWTGFAYSNMTAGDSADTKMYSTYAGYLYFNGYTFFISRNAMDSDGNPVPNEVCFTDASGDPISDTMAGAYVTNTTAVADAVLKGVDGTGAFGNGDWLKLTVTGADAEGKATGSKDFYLADFRNSAKNVVKKWSWMDLSSLGTVQKLTFQVTSSQKAIPPCFAMTILNIRKDHSAPSIKVKSPKARTTVGSAYVHGEVTATDYVDGDLTDRIEVAGDKVDTSKPGVYHVTYHVADAAGNEAEEASRIVVVEADSDNDGIGDAWEMAHFGDLTTADATSDCNAGPDSSKNTLDIDDYRQGKGPYSNAIKDENGALDAGIPGFVGPAGDGVVAADDQKNTVNPLFTGWATRLVDYTPAPGVASCWTNTSKALGPVTGNNMDIVSLGDMDQAAIDAWTDDPATNPGPGEITLYFDKPIIDGEGPDFAVFENGFVINTGGFFAELGYVEVSSDGDHFLRFPSRSLSLGSPGDYGGVDPTDVYNLAGKHGNAYKNSWGTPFDLEEFKGHEKVVDGTVDLNKIRYVKCVDIPGSGDFNDSEGHGIYDAWVTWGSGGLDLEAVGALHQDTASDPVPFAGTGSLRGRLVEPTVLNGITVAINGVETEPSYVRHGTLTFNTVPAADSFTLTFSSPYIETFSLDNVAMEKGNIKGAVTEGMIGSPDLGGVDVTIEGSHRKTTTKDDGSYSFKYLASGTYTLVFSRAGKELYRQPDVGLTEGKLKVTINRNMIETDAVLAGARVSLDGAELETVTDERGAFSFDKVPTGTYSLTIGGEHVVSKTTSKAVTVSKDKATQVDCELFTATRESILGSICVDAATKKGLLYKNTVRLTDSQTGQEVATTRTAADGSYHFTGIPPGTYDASIENFRLKTKRLENIVVRNDRATLVPAVKMTARRFTIRGKVVSAETGAPLGGVTVSVYDYDTEELKKGPGAVIAQARTEGKGAYAFTDLCISKHAYTFKFEAAHCMPQELEGIDVTQYETAPVQTVELRMPKVSGIAVINGRPVSHTAVTLYSTATGKTWTAMTDAEGRFAFSGVVFERGLMLTIKSAEYGNLTEELSTADGDVEAEFVFANTPPHQPVFTAPGQNDRLDTLTPVLTTEAFVDKNHQHGKTTWQIFDKTKLDDAGLLIDDVLDSKGTLTDIHKNMLVYEVTGDSCLTSLPVPDYLLVAGLEYYVRVKFYDNCAAAPMGSLWSDWLVFGVNSEPDGMKRVNGGETLVPESAILAPEENHFGDDVIALKGSGVDAYAAANIGVEKTDAGRISQVSTCAVAALDQVAKDSKPKDLELPLGLLGFNLEIDEAKVTDGVVTVTIHFDVPVPEDMTWWKYDASKDTWRDYSAHSVFAKDRLSVALEIQDGGYGDFDGVKNGRIVDPGGVGRDKSASSLDDTQGGGGGCFISTAFGHHSACHKQSVVAWLLGIVTGGAIAVAGGRRHVNSAPR